MKIRILVPRSGLEGAAGDVVEVADAPGRALVAGGWAEETSAKVGAFEDSEPAPPEEPMDEPEPEVVVEETDTGTGEYEGRTRVQLVQLARSKRIKGAAQMTKDELIEALRG